MDTGAPVTCANESKGALFHFQPVPPGGGSPTLILNGERHRMAFIPQLEFGGVRVRGFSVALVNLSSLNTSLARNGDRADDAILGLDALTSLHAVIDCGARRLFLHPDSSRGIVPVAKLKAAGWREIPMRIQDQHLTVACLVNGKPARFLVDTGAPISVIDTAFCRKKNIPVRQRTFSMKAIHYETRAAQIGTVDDLQIGSLYLGQNLVGIFDLSVLLGANSGAQPVTGLIGSQTLERLRAIIDCDGMKLYLHPSNDEGLPVF